MHLINMNLSCPVDAEVIRVDNGCGPKQRDLCKLWHSLEI